MVYFPFLFIMLIVRLSVHLAGGVSILLIFSNKLIFTLLIFSALSLFLDLLVFSLIFMFPFLGSICSFFVLAFWWKWLLDFILWPANPKYFLIPVLFAELCFRLRAFILFQLNMLSSGFHSFWLQVNHYFKCSFSPLPSFLLWKPRPLI